MFIYNTTFSIKENLIDKGIKYIQTEYIPNLEDDGFGRAILLKIHSKPDDGYINYAVQFSASSLEFIADWKNVSENDYIKDMRQRFGEDILSFSTIMETI